MFVPACRPHRPVCYRCRKPRVTCVCDKIVPIQNRTEIDIVQHIREQTHAVGTARFGALGLARVRLETVAPSEGVFRSNLKFPPGTALLYPSRKALPLERLSPSERPARLVVIDGTWPQASRIFRDSPNLRALPPVTFAEEKPSNYRIRMEPDAAANATVEAICRALRILEPDTPGIGGLLAAFDAMIDQQLGYIESGTPRPNRRKNRYKKAGIPRRLQDADVRVTAAVGGPFSPSGTKNCWEWHAIRLHDNAVFSERLASPSQSNEISEIPAGVLSQDAFRLAWQRFIGPTDLLVTWDNKSMGRLFEVVGPHPHFVFLKAAYGNLHRGTVKTIDALIEKERLKMPDTDRFAGIPSGAEPLAKMVRAVDFLKEIAKQTA